LKLVPVRVHGLVLEHKTQQHVVVLREDEGDRILPIWIGPGEAMAIKRLIAEEPFPRPLTHDLIALIVEGLKAKVARVVIHDLKESTFFATIIVEREQSVLSVDARPSDSIAVALRTKAPLFANEALLQAPSDDDEEGAEREGPPPGGPGEPERPLTPEEQAERLRRYLEDLNPEDFGKFRP
jgi:hypothetical protein